MLRWGQRLSAYVPLCLRVCLLAALWPAPARADEATGLWPLRVQAHTLDGFVHAFAQGPDGLVWTAGDGGLQHFDGRRFALVEVGAPRVVRISAVAVDGRGAIWFFRQNEGLVRLMPSGQMVVFREGLPAGAVIDLRIDADEVLWAIGRHGVSRLPLRKSDGARALVPLSLPRGGNIQGAFVDRARAVWLDTTAGFVRLGDVPLVRALTGGRQNKPERLRELSQIALDDAGRAALARVDERQLGRFIEAMLQDRRGRVWVATTEGVRVLTADGTVAVRSREGLPDDHVIRLEEDREGNVWALTHGGGLASMSPSPVARLGAREGLEGNTPFAIAETSDGTIWVTTTNGLSFVRAGKPTFVGHGGFGQLRAIAATSDGALWLGTLGERLVRYEPATGRFTARELPAGAPHTHFPALESDGDRVLAGGTDGALLRVSRDGVIETLRSPQDSCIPAKDGRCPARIAAFAPRAAGGHWIGTVADGLWILGAAGLEPVPLTSRQRGLWSLHEDAAGTLWVVSETGLSHLRQGRLEPVPDAPAEALFHVVSDGAGFVWVGGLRGLVRLPGTGVIRPTVYTTKDSLPSDQLMPGLSKGALRDRSGRVWFTSLTGLAVASFDAPPEPPAPSPYFGELQANGVAFKYPFPRKVELPPGRGEIAISYGAAAFAAPHRVRFSYLLEGHDDAWIDAGARPVAHYTNLRPRPYVFRLRAFNVDRPGEVAEATLAVTLLPRFRERPIFFVLLALGGAALLAIAVALRLRTLRARFAAVLAERHRIARDLHDTLAQVFAGLGFQIENVVATRRARGEAPEPALEQLRRMTGQGRRAARAVVWNLRAGTGTPGSIVRGLEELTGIYDGARVCLRVAGTPYALPVAVETELLYVAQQAVSNAIEHGGAREIGIDVEFGREAFELWIRDDGRGFAADAATAGAPGHFGLLGMRERAQRAGGKISIESVPDVGTEIGVTIERRSLPRKPYL